MPPVTRSLQTLIRLRQSLERQEEMKLALASQKLTAAETRLEDEYRDRNHNQAAAMRELMEGMNGAELGLVQVQWEAARARTNLLQGRVAELTQERRHQIENLIQRARDRKVLEKLRDRRQAEANLNASRRVQQESDDAHARSPQH